MRILLLEDNYRLGELIHQHLSAAGYVVDRVDSLADFSAIPDLCVYSLLMVDLGLPDGDGLDVIRSCRKANVTIPIIVITAKVSISDRVNGLNSGADDYLVKPFHVAELIARVQALMRRPHQIQPNRLVAGRIVLEVPGGPVLVDGTQINMSRVELKLLALLMRRPGSIVTRETIMNQIYDHDHPATPNAIEKVVSRLRKTLEGTNPSVDVKLIRGIGYALEMNA